LTKHALSKQFHVNWNSMLLLYTFKYLLELAIKFFKIFSVSPQNESLVGDVLTIILMSLNMSFPKIII
jgi:hypothetical protein